MHEGGVRQTPRCADIEDHDDWQATKAVARSLDEAGYFKLMFAVRVHRQADEPAKRQIIIDLLHQLAFRAHTIEGLRQRRPRQHLWRNRGRPIGE